MLQLVFRLRTGRCDGGSIHRVDRGALLQAYHPPGVALAMYSALLHLGSWFAIEVVLPFTLRAVSSTAMISRLLSSWPRYPVPCQTEAGGLNSSETSITNFSSGLAASHIIPMGVSMISSPVSLLVTERGVERIDGPSLASVRRRDGPYIDFSRIANFSGRLAD